MNIKNRRIYLITGRRKPFPKPTETLPSACLLSDEYSLFILSDESFYSSSNGYAYNRQKEAFPKRSERLPSAWLHTFTLRVTGKLITGRRKPFPNRRKRFLLPDGNASFYLFHTIRRISYTLLLYEYGFNEGRRQ